MQIGVHLLHFGPRATVDGLFDIASAVEDLGFGSLWLFDHLIGPTQLETPYPATSSGQYGFQPHFPYFEALSVLAALAARTRRVRLGTRVLVPLYRPPVVLAKQLATIDAIAKGRLVLGVGTGWMREEFDAVGVSMDRRLARLDEHVELMQRAWRQVVSSYEGEFYRHVEAGFHPQPCQPGNTIPVVLGGIRDAVLRRVAAYADGWAVWSPPSGGRDSHTLIAPSLLEERLATLRRFCDEVGRDFDELTIVTSGRFSSSVDELRAHAELGVSVCDLVSFAPPHAIVERATRFAETVGTEVAG